MISIERCSEILKTNGIKADREAITEIRNYLYLIASLQEEEAHNDNSTNRLTVN
jgi:hypothetical protein